MSLVPVPLSVSQKLRSAGVRVEPGEVPEGWPVPTAWLVPEWAARFWEEAAPHAGQGRTPTLHTLARAAPLLAPADALELALAAAAVLSLSGSAAAMQLVNESYRRSLGVPDAGEAAP